MIENQNITKPTADNFTNFKEYNNAVKAYTKGMILFNKTLRKSFPDDLFSFYSVDSYPEDKVIYIDASTDASNIDGAFQIVFNDDYEEECIEIFKENIENCPFNLYRCTNLKELNDTLADIFNIDDEDFTLYDETEQASGEW